MAKYLVRGEEQNACRAFGVEMSAVNCNGNDNQLIFLLRLGVHAAGNSAYTGYYPELWILRYPAHRYRAVPSPGFEPTTLWLRVRRPNHSATTLQTSMMIDNSPDELIVDEFILHVHVFRLAWE
jgi:hypothetical protein